MSEDDDKGLVGAFARMMYGPNGAPDPVTWEPEPPGLALRERLVLGAVYTVIFALSLAVVFGVVMGCIAIFQAVLG